MLALTKRKQQIDVLSNILLEKFDTNPKIFQLISKLNSFNKLDVFDEYPIIKKKPLSQLTKSKESYDSYDTWRGKI